MQKGSKGNLNNSIVSREDTNLIILAARPAVGKTAFALNLVLSAFYNNIKKVNVGVFSLEMSKLQLTQRMISKHGTVELNKIRKGTCTPAEFEKIQATGLLLAQAGIFIDDAAGINIRELKVKAKKMKRKDKVGLIVIDYLQLMSGTGEKNGNREQEVAEISRQLKILAKDLELPIIALAQLNRNSENRKDPEPQLSDLRESGSIEQDADTVLFLYKTADSRGQICLKVAKNRHDREERFGVWFEGRYQDFSGMVMLDANGGYMRPVDAPGIEEGVKQPESGNLTVKNNNADKKTDDADDDLPF